MGWSSSLLTEERAGKSLSWPIFSRNAVGLEQQEDHRPGLRPALPQPGRALTSSRGCLSPTPDGRRGGSRSISPTHPHSCPPVNTPQVLPRTPYLSTVTFVPAPSPAWLSSRDQWRRDREGERERAVLFISSCSLPTRSSSPRDHGGGGEGNLDIKTSTPIYPDAFSDFCSSISLSPSSDS